MLPYATYVFFEKLRVRDGKPKTAFRVKMEIIYDGSDEDLCGEDGMPGMDVKQKPERNYFVFEGDNSVPVEDVYGRVTIG